MPKTLKEAVEGVLRGDNISEDEQKTLKPGSKKKDPPQKLPGEVQDLGKAVTSPDDAGHHPEKGVKGKMNAPGKTPPKGEAAKKLKATVKMQEAEENEEEAIVEDEELEEDEIVAEAEEETDEEVVSEEEEADDDAEEIVEEDEADEEDEVVAEEEEEIVLPSVENLEIDLSEDVAAMFDGHELSEDFKEKATTIFEAAVRSNLKKYEAQLAEMFEENLMEAVEAIKEDMESDVDKYMNYVVEEWMDDNQVAVESSLRLELAEDVMNGIKDVFVEHYIDIPEDKVDVVEALTAQLDEAKAELNEAIESNADLHNALNESRKERILSDLTEGLTETQAEKIATLAEGVEFSDEGTYAEKISTLVESYSGKERPKAAKQLDEEIIEDPEANKVNEELSGTMAKYVDAIGKLKK